MSRTGYAKIIDKQNLVRDMNTQAVLNTDLVAVRRHEKRLQELQKEEARDEALRMLRADVDEIKQLLRGLSRPEAK